jgi:hypothetical protein
LPYTWCGLPADHDGPHRCYSREGDQAEWTDDPEGDPRANLDDVMAAVDDAQPTDEVQQEIDAVRHAEAHHRDLAAEVGRLDTEARDRSAAKHEMSDHATER